MVAALHRPEIYTSAPEVVLLAHLIRDLATPQTHHGRLLAAFLIHHDARQVMYPTHHDQDPLTSLIRIPES